MASRVDQEQLERASRRVREGGLVAFPTETVYGLGADATSQSAVEGVFRAKGRPPNNPLIVHVDSVAMARTLVREWTGEAQALADAFWPGPLTIVLPAGDAIPRVVTGGGANVGVRMPAHEVALELIRRSGRPLVGPSANRSGGVSPTRGEHVRESLAGVMVLDAGACPGGIESTVVSIVPGEPARVLRPGPVGGDAIARIIGRPVWTSATVEEVAAGAPLESPGMLAGHYAPRTRAVMFSRGQLARVLSARPFAVVLSHEELAVDRPHRLMSLGPDARGYGAGLYAALIEADALGAGLIAVLEPPEGDAEHRALWSAIRDRLGRATRPLDGHDPPG